MRNMKSAIACAALASVLCMVGNGLAGQNGQIKKVVKQDNQIAKADRQLTKITPALAKLNLTDDQKAQIEQIQQTTQQQIDALQAKQISDIRALLTDEQKAQFDAAQPNTGKGARKAARLNGPTSQPTPTT